LTQDRTGSGSLNPNPWACKKKVDWTILFKQLKIGYSTIPFLINEKVSKCHGR